MADYVDWETYKDKEESHNYLNKNKKAKKKSKITFNKEFTRRRKSTKARGLKLFS
jgi:hypothetical protein